ncbi:MAG: alpha/beta hydrolase, partial [Bacteroidota bacterium]
MKLRYSYLSICLCLLTTFTIQAQNRTGNIVEYFGKEKVEEINEGNLLHVFTQGLILPKKGMSFGPESVLSDPILAEALLNEKLEISAGKSVVLEGQSLDWTPIEINEKSEFS